MRKKVFVSYKYADDRVYSLHYRYTTVRDYVDELMFIFAGHDIAIYKGEKDNESLEGFSDTTIQKKLSERLRDSSITVVLISPNMRSFVVSESEQWIPWEVSYSLRVTHYNGRVSRPNALLFVVLPDESNSYAYFDNLLLFPIIKDNLDNNYGVRVNWNKFVNNPVKYFVMAEEHRDAHLSSRVVNFDKYRFI